MSDSLNPIAYQAPLSMEFSRQEYWSGLPFPSPGNLPDPGIEPRSLTLRADSLPSEPPGKPSKVRSALRVEHSSNRFSVFMKWNTRELPLCLFVFCSISLPHPPSCPRMHQEASLGRKSSYQNLTLLAPYRLWADSEQRGPLGVCNFFTLHRLMLAF